jgi:putative membrane protein
MTTTNVLLSAWDWEPSIIVGCAALIAAYFFATRGASDSPVRKISFLTGTLLLLIDLVSPIDALGDSYLLSVHVVQHLFLALIIPPLWLLGLPSRFVESTLRVPPIARAERILSNPYLAWTLGVGAMLTWHIPPLFNAALRSDPIHIVQHLSFLVTGTVFWWPIACPLSARRLPPLAAMVYLFSACTGCSLLGAVLTFTPPGAYPAYLNPEDTLHILPLIRDQWGLDPRSDQQLGGLLMWVPGCLVYLSAILASFARWYAAPERTANHPA